VAERLRYQEMVPLDAIAFEPGIYLVNRVLCEELREAQPPAGYQRVRLVIGDMPASRIADVNRGIFMPLSAASDRPLTFTLTL
jgi:hypothetical protein